MSFTLNSRQTYEKDYEWTTVETVLIRITASLVPRGSFPVYSNVAYGYRVGFDAAVCVQKYEPWVIEAYNTSVASPSMLRIIEKGNGNTSSPSGSIRGPPIENTRYLHGMGNDTSFAIAHGNGVHQMLRANFESHPYFSSPTVGFIAAPRRNFF